MYRTIIIIALCLSGLAQAQEPRRSAQEVWNELYAQREGREYQFNKFLAETEVFGRLRVLYYEDTVAPADWEKSGGKPVPIVRFIAVKERAARDSR